MTIYGYTRVSTNIQAEEGESLEIQAQKIHAAATLYCGGQPVKHIYRELGVSGAKPLATRPQGALMLAALQPGDVVIAAKLDRMFRSAVDAVQWLEKFKKRGFKLYLLDLGGDVTGDGVSGLVFTILSAVAQFERERICERITEAKAYCKSKGMYAGGEVPFGYRLAKNPDKSLTGLLEPIRSELLIIDDIMVYKKAGSSLRAIATFISAKHSIKMNHMKVQRIINREMARDETPIDHPL